MTYETDQECLYKVQSSSMYQHHEDPNKTGIQVYLYTNIRQTVEDILMDHKSP